MATRPEKKLSTLPPIRLGERLELALMRMAAADNRTLTDYVRVWLQRHAFGHAASLGEESAFGEDLRASQRGAQDSRPGDLGS